MPRLELDSAYWRGGWVDQVGVVLLQVPAPFIGARRQRIADSIPKLRHIGSVRELRAVIRLAVSALLGRVGGVVYRVLVPVTHTIFAELASQKDSPHGDDDKEDDTRKENANGDCYVFGATVAWRGS